MQKRVIILFGPPGAGKGTQAELLSEKLGFYLFETSKLLERSFRNAGENPQERFVEIEGGKFDVLNEKKIWESGTLNSPPWVTHCIVIKEVRKLFEQGESLILAGSPRTLYEAERVTPVLAELYGKENIRIFLIEISAEVTVFRNTHRKICELMRHSILFNDETKNLTLCPLDGSRLMRRESLDDPETIKTRLVQYKERTLPMLDYFKKNGFKVNKINGEKYVSEVHDEILKCL